MAKIEFSKEEKDIIVRTLNEAICELEKPTDFVK